MTKVVLPPLSIADLESTRSQIRKNVFLSTERKFGFKNMVQLKKQDASPSDIIRCVKTFVKNYHDEEHIREVLRTKTLAGHYFSTTDLVSVIMENKHKRKMTEATEDLIYSEFGVELIKGLPLRVFDSETEHPQYVLKVIPGEILFPKDKDPSRVEAEIHSYLTDQLVVKKVSPHIVHYLGKFPVFMNSVAIKEFDLGKNNLLRGKGLTVVTEYVQGPTLNDWLEDDADSFSDTEFSELVKNIVFQITFTLLAMNALDINHNDLHSSNVILQNREPVPGAYDVYVLKKSGTTKTFYVPKTSVFPKICDFELSMYYPKTQKFATTCENFKIIGPDYEYYSYDHVSRSFEWASDAEHELYWDSVPLRYNEVYDLHFLLTDIVTGHRMTEDLYNAIAGLYTEDMLPDPDSESDSDSDSDPETSGSASERSQDVDTDDNDSEYSDCSTESEDRGPISSEGRLILGNLTADMIENLPTPARLLLSGTLFSRLEVVPADFNPSESRNQTWTLEL